MAILSTVLQNKLVMSCDLYIYKQSISFQNYFDILSGLCQGKRTRFLISDVSAGNTTLVARVRRVEQASSTAKIK